VRAPSWRAWVVLAAPIVAITVVIAAGFLPSYSARRASPRPVGSPLPAPSSVSTQVKGYAVCANPTRCPPVPVEPITVGEVDKALRQLPEGKLQYGYPPTMQEGVTETVELGITADFSTSLEHQLDGHVSAAKRVNVSTVMSARLTGSAFEISPVTDERQAVGRSGVTIWSWHITPHNSGVHVLELVVAVHIAVPGLGEAAHDYPVFKQEIRVRVNWPQEVRSFFASNWQWLFTLLVGSAGTGLGVRILQSKRARRHRREHPRRRTKRVRSQRTRRV